MRAERILALTLSLSLAVTACSNSQASLDPTPSTAVQAPTASPSARPTLLHPTSTVPSPGQGELPPDCRPGEGMDILSLDPAIRDPLEATLEYLVSAGDAAGLQDYLQGIGAFPDLDTPEGIESGSVTAHVKDLTGDGTAEFLITISAPTSSLTSIAAWFVGYLCPDGSTAFHGALTEECLGDCAFDLAVQDVAGLGYPQLIVLEQAAPEGYTCPYTNFLLTAPQRDGWHTFLDARPLEFGPACTVSFEANSSQPSKNIILEGYRFGGGGTLPGRIVLEAYSYDEGQLAYVLSRREYLPSAYRIHVLEDAQHALDAGQPGKALALYRIAMFDTLINYPSDAEQDVLPSFEGYSDETPSPPFAYQTSFAKFRSIVLLEALGYHEDAEQYLRLMSPGADLGGEFTEMASRFLALIEEGNSWSSACRTAANEIAEKHPLLLGHDGHIGYWGPSTVSYDASTVCPSLSGG